MVWVRHARYRMGTVWEMVVASSRRQQALIALDDAFKEVARLEHLMSHFLPASQVNRIVKMAGQGAVVVDSSLYDVFTQAQAVATLTAGAFDVTMGPLIALWGRAERRGVLPTSVQLRCGRSLVGYRDLILQRAGPTAMLMRAGMSLDLGAIGKGFAVDQVVEQLRRHGCTRGWVNAGGNVRFLGSWDREVTVRDPRHPGRALLRLAIDGGAVSTSANSERGWRIGDAWYGHLLDPRTGWPASKCLSVTVVAASAALADALSTAYFVLGPERAQAMRATFPQVETLWCVSDGQDRVRIVTTPGIHERIRSLPGCEEEAIHVDVSLA